jgi:hypothetical protein
MRTLGIPRRSGTTSRAEKRASLTTRRYAAANGRDGSGPVRERYLTGPFDTADQAQWRTEVCWPMAPAGPDAN